MPFTSLGLKLAQTFIAAQLTVCPLPPSVPKVNIYFFPKAPVLITEAPMKALTAEVKRNPNSTASSHKGFVVFGLTEPQIIDGGARVKLSTVQDAQGNTCIGVEQVDVVIHYKATIFLAKELQDFPCQLTVTQLHENQHVAFDHEVMKDYIPKIKMDMLWHLRSLGMMGPFTAQEAPAKANSITKGIMASAVPMIKKLGEVRLAKQGSIDTEENYRAESLKCPDERAKLLDVLKEVLK